MTIKIKASVPPLLKRQERIQRDIKILKSHAKRFNKEAKENLKF